MGDEEKVIRALVGALVGIRGVAELGDCVAVIAIATGATQYVLDKGFLPAPVTVSLLERLREEAVEEIGRC